MMTVMSTIILTFVGIISVLFSDMDIFMKIFLVGLAIYVMYYLVEEFLE